LDIGCKLRVCRVTHFESNADTADKASTTDFQVTGAVNGFNLTPKYPGAKYNDLRAEVKAASNGNASYFDLVIWINGDASFTPETYKNLIISGNPTVANSNYLQEVAQKSMIVDVVYKDLSGTTGQVRPTNVVKTYTGGSNGDAVIATDYVGNSTAKNGFYAFDGISDIWGITAPEMSDTTIHIGGASYVAVRKDMRYLGHLSNASNSTTELIAERASITVDTPYALYTAGGLKVIHPDTGAEKEISEVADVLGCFALTHSKYGAWFSASGTKRGKIYNALGVVNNFGGPGAQADRDILANNQINLVVLEDSSIYLKGNFSGTLSNSKMSWNNIVDLIIFIRKSTTPSFENYIEEPADFITMRHMYQEVNPFLQSLVDKRALYSARYVGDQGATKLEDLQINTPDDLDNGKLRVRMFIKPINAVNEIAVDVVITKSGVSFEDVLI
jgi:hypothetical protein